MATTSGFKKIRNSRGTLFYLQVQVATINSVNQKSTPDCHKWYKKVSPRPGTCPPLNSIGIQTDSVEPVRLGKSIINS